MKYIITILLAWNIALTIMIYTDYDNNRQELTNLKTQTNKIDYLVSNLWAVEHCDLFIKKRTVLIKKLKDLEAALIMED